MTITQARKTARKQLAALLETALVGVGLLAQGVYSYRVGDLAGITPAVVVSSAGTLREPFTMEGTNPTYTLQVDIFVLYSDGDTWTEENAEDRLDDIEQKISEVIAANQVTDYWDALTQDGMSERVDIDIGGVEYIHEAIMVQVV